MQSRRFNLHFHTDHRHDEVIILRHPQTTMPQCLLYYPTAWNRISLNNLLLLNQFAQRLLFILFS
jgi:hypothetical protein